MEDNRFKTLDKYDDELDKIYEQWGRRKCSLIFIKINININKDALHRGGNLK